MFGCFSNSFGNKITDFLRQCIIVVHVMLVCVSISQTFHVVVFGFIFTWKEKNKLHKAHVHVRYLLSMVQN